MVFSLVAFDGVQELICIAGSKGSEIKKGCRRTACSIL